MVYNPKVPYDDLPLLPPKVEINTIPILTQCIKASRALGELKGAGAMIPDQTILINAIPLQEAKLSSEIENIVTTHDELFYANLGGKSSFDPKAKEVLRYRTALKFGYDSLQNTKLNVDLISKICGILLEDDIKIRGESDAVYIVQRSNNNVVYTPPFGGPSLMKTMKNLEEFLNNYEDIDPLIRLAVAHYQFEAIHPFRDGNGRTGRILNILFLIQNNLIEIPVLYLSRYIIQNKPDYYHLLRRVTEESAWEDWIIYMLKGIEETALWTTERIHAIYDLPEQTIQRCRKEIPDIYSKELIELIFKQPYCKIKFLVEANIAERQTASRYLQKLEKIGILVSEKRGRERIYKNPALIKVLTA
jgi:Fic family protein